MTQPRSYRDVLADKGYTPLRIERTQKQAGHLVLGNAHRPLWRVPA